MTGRLVTLTILAVVLSGVAFWLASADPTTPPHGTDRGRSPGGSAHASTPAEGRGEGATPAPERRSVAARPPGGRSDGSGSAGSDPVLAAGRLADTSGRGMAGIEVRLVPYREDGGWGTIAREYRHAEAIACTSGTDGRFEIRGTREAPFRLACERAGLAPVEPCFLDEPDRDLVVVLARLGGLQVKLAEGSREACPLLTMEVRAPGEHQAIDSESVSFEHTTAIRTGLLPGVYDVALLGSSPAPLWLIERVVVPEGGRPDDPRLSGIDMRRIVRDITITVLGLDGTPLDDTTIRRQHPDSVETLTTDEQGRARMQVGVEGADLVIAQTGTRVVRLEGLRDDRVVRLEPPFGLRVTLTGVAAARLQRSIFRVEASPLAPGNGTGPTAVFAAGRGSSFRLRVTEPGPYALRWALDLRTAPMPPGAFRALLDTARPPTSAERRVEILPTDGVQTFELPISIADLESAEARRAEIVDRTRPLPNEDLRSWTERVMQLDAALGGRR